MTIVSNKIAGDLIQSADIDAIVNKLQNGSDLNVRVSNIRVVTGTTGTRIQNSIQDIASTGGIVYVPSGIYSLGTTLTIGTDGICILGESKTTTRLHRTGTTSSFSILIRATDTGYTGVQQPQIRNLTLTGGGLEIFHCRDGTFRDILIGNCGTAGVSVSSAMYVSRFENVFLSSASAIGYGIDFLGDANGTIISGGWWEPWSHGGIRMGSTANGNSIYGNYFETSSTASIYLDGCQNNAMFGNYLTGVNSGGAHIIIASGYGNRIFGNTFKGGNSEKLGIGVSCRGGNNNSIDLNSFFQLSTGIIIRPGVTSTRVGLTNQYISSGTSVSDSGSDTIAEAFTSLSLNSLNLSSVNRIRSATSTGATAALILDARRSVAGGSNFQINGLKSDLASLQNSLVIVSGYNTHRILVENSNLEFDTTSSAAMILRTKTGTPADIDVRNPTAGHIIWDNTNKKLYLRGTNTWSSAVFT